MAHFVPSMLRCKDCSFLPSRSSLMNVFMVISCLLKMLLLRCCYDGSLVGGLDCGCAVKLMWLVGWLRTSWLRCLHREHAYWAARQNSAPSRGTNPPNGGLFHATAATNHICAGAGAGSGEWHAETKKRTFKAPAPHHSAPRGGHPECAPPHAPSPTRPRHGAGIRPPKGRHSSSGHIRARLAPVLYVASFVIRCRRQWCTHICVKTAVSSLLKPRSLV